MLDGVLYRFCEDRDTENGRIVIPKSMRNLILNKYHDDPTAGHYRIERTINRITPNYYWPKMRAEITQLVKSCIECKRFKPTNLKSHGLLQTVSSNKRFEIVAGFFGPLLLWILIVEDICTRWIEFFQLQEPSAENFSLILIFCLNIEETFTPVYHPEANPLERKNRDLKIQMSIFVGKDHTTWHKKLALFIIYFQ